MRDILLLAAGVALGYVVNAIVGWAIKDWLDQRKEIARAALNRKLLSIAGDVGALCVLGWLGISRFSGDGPATKIDVLVGVALVLGILFFVVALLVDLIAWSMLFAKAQKSDSDGTPKP